MEPANDIHNVIGARRGVAITASDSATIEPTRGIWVAVAGDIFVDFYEGGTNVKLGNMTAGGWHPMVITRIYLTGTTATGIVAGY